MSLYDERRLHFLHWGGLVILNIILPNITRRGPEAWEKQRVSRVIIDSLILTGCHDQMSHTNNIKMAWGRSAPRRRGGKCEISRSERAVTQLKQDGSVWCHVTARQAALLYHKILTRENSARLYSWQHPTVVSHNSPFPWSACRESFREIKWSNKLNLLSKRISSQSDSLSHVLLNKHLHFD